MSDPEVTAQPGTRHAESIGRGWRSDLCIAGRDGCGVLGCFCSCHGGTGQWRPTPAPLHVEDLAERLKGVIEEKLAIARAAGGECPAWDIRSVPPFTDPLLLGADGDMYITLGTVDLDEPQREHIVAHDPAWAIRQHEAALRVLERHAPIDTVRRPSRVPPMCQYDWADGDGWPTRWPCQDVRDLADVYGVPVDTEKTPGGTDDE